MKVSVKIMSAMTGHNATKGTSLLRHYQNASGGTTRKGSVVKEPVVRISNAFWIIRKALRYNDMLLTRATIRSSKSIQAHARVMIDAVYAGSLVIAEKKFFQIKTQFLLVKKQESGRATREKELCQITIKARSYFWIILS